MIVAALERFKSFIQEQALCEAGHAVLLGVSGGQDSVLLTHLFNQSGFKFGIAHCNFMLREAESDSDERFVSALADRMQVSFFSQQLDAKAYASAHNLSIQMAAREMRYEWFEKIRREFDFDYIALAHHQNDTVETILLNLIRGTGIAGLHGILPKRQKIIRPMLCFSRAEIHELVTAMNLAYREDSSNLSSKYSRNKIRLEIVPRLKELNPNLEQTFERNRKRFVDLEVLLQDRLSELRRNLFKEIGVDEFQIELASLKALRPLGTLLFGLFSPFGFTEAVLLDLVKSWEGSPGKVFESKEYGLLLDRHCVLLSKKKVALSIDVMIHESTKKIRWADVEFCIDSSAIEKFDLRREASFAQLDWQLLNFPLKIRSWQAGDIFCPLGMHGKKKKLSDFFIEKKIPLNYKSQIPLLINGNGDILYVIGYRIDDRYKVSPKTKKVFIFGRKSKKHEERDSV